MPLCINRVWPHKTTMQLQLFSSELQFISTTTKLFNLKWFAIYSNFRCFRGFYNWLENLFLEILLLYYRECHDSLVDPLNLIHEIYHGDIRQYLLTCSLSFFEAGKVAQEIYLTVSIFSFLVIVPYNCLKNMYIYSHSPSESKCNHTITLFIKIDTCMHLQLM